MQRVRLPAEQRRQDILNHAAHLFADQGFEAVSMGTIAQAIGTSRPNVYTYFPDLVSVLRVLLDRRLSDLEAELTPQLGPGASLNLSALWEHARAAPADPPAAALRRRACPSCRT